jgi:rubrerythrin
VIRLNNNELQILKKAILNEMEGQQFYIIAAQLVEDLDTKQALLHLAQEEERHRTWLEELYQNISSGENINLTALEKDATPGIFEPEKVKPEAGSIEVSVFRIGILMEKASMEYYRQAAQEAQNPEVKELCQRLATWETGHLKMLEETYDYLREEWWDKQGFSPA